MQFFQKVNCQVFLYAAEHWPVSASFCIFLLLTTCDTCTKYVSANSPFSKF